MISRIEIAKTINQIRQDAAELYEAARIEWLIASPKHGSPDQFEIDNRQS